MFEKLQIYYEPGDNSEHQFKSLSVKYSEFDEENNTYKKKIVLEKNGEKYKIKQYLDFASIKPFLYSLNLDNYTSSGVQEDSGYFYIKFGEQRFSTSNKEDIREILEWAGFDEILGYELDKYEKCD